jgi:RNA polymerase sigma-70 factor (ECF subfamily)
LTLKEGTWWKERMPAEFSPEQEDILSGCFDLIFPTLLRMTGNRETALDLTQDTFLKAWEKMNGFEARSSFSTWLYRIAVNLTLNHLKRSKKVIYTEIDPALIAEGLPDESIEKRFEMAAVRESVLSLPPNLRACVVLHYFEAKPLDEIADILGIARGTAAWRLHVARKQLKVELKRGGIIP